MESWIGGKLTAGSEGVIPGTLSDSFLADHGNISGALLMAMPVPLEPGSAARMATRRKTELNFRAVSCLHDGAGKRIRKIGAAGLLSKVLLVLASEQLWQNQKTKTPIGRRAQVTFTIYLFQQW